jgi:predicted MFS family arabinose efflux permease
MSTAVMAGGRGRTGAALLAAAVALAFADSSIVMLGLPEIYGELDASISGVSLVITAYNLVVAVVALALVPVVGRARPAVLVGAGLVVFAVASLACGLVDELALLVALRAVQGLGGALLLAASLPVMAALTGSVAAGRAWWGLAGTLGAVLGPAAGGILTELFDWRAIFLAQAPVAALALLALAAPAVRGLGPEGGRPPRVRILANLGLVFAFGALVGALFLAVLMIVTAWDLGPLAGAVVVSALPVAAVAVRPLSQRAGPAAGGIAGSLLLAAGLVALALLPGVGSAWAAVALAVCGAGFGLLVPPLTAESVAGERGLASAAAASVGARHVGLVAVLLIVAPLLTADLTDGGDRATLNATQVILDAPIGLQQKVPIALDIADEFSRAPKGEVPDVARAFDENGAQDDANVAAVRDDLIETIEAALTGSFRASYLVSAAFALLALVPVAVAAWRRGARPRRGPPGTLAPTAWLVGLVVGAGALVGGAAAAGGAGLGDPTTRDPCVVIPREGGGGIDATLQGVVLDGLAGAACDLGVSRENLVLSFGSDVGTERVPWDPPTVERAVRSGLVRAIDDAEDRGSLNSVVADVLRGLARRAPVDELIRGTAAAGDAAGGLGELDAGDVIDVIRDALP